MAAPIQEYTIIEVRKPNVGENKPADVTADIVIDTTSELKHHTLMKWEWLWVVYSCRCWSGIRFA